MRYYYIVAAPGSLIYTLSYFQISAETITLVSEIQKESELPTDASLSPPFFMEVLFR